MNARIFRRTLIRVISLIIVTVAIVICSQYYNFLHSNQVPYKNLRIRSSSGCYIYFKIKHQEKIYLVVCPSESAYYMIKADKKIPYPFFFFIYQIGNKIKNNRYININETLDKSFSYYVVNEDLLKKKYGTIVDPNLIRQDGYLNYNLDWEDQKAIIYSLLKEGINCCYHSEAGQNSVFISKNPQNQKLN